MLVPSPGRVRLSQARPYADSFLRGGCLPGTRTHFIAATLAAGDVAGQHNDGERAEDWRRRALPKAPPPLAAAVEFARPA